MKLTAIILLTACLAAGATGNAQNITLKENNATLEQLFQQVRKQSGLPVLYTRSMVENAAKVSVNLQNVSLQKAMDEILKNVALTYSIVNNTIVIKEKTIVPNETAIVDLPPPAIDIKGRITDEEGEPLVGASIKVKGSNTIAVTDADGRFVLKGVDENATLEISYIGFLNGKIEVKSRTDVALSLKRSDNPLDVVQIQAYGTTNRRIGTGNISTVKAADIAKQPVSNPLLALAGRVPGLTVTQTNGLSGGGVTVRIQGQNSIGKGNDPLYIIDGVPYISQLPSTGLSTVLGTSGANVTAGVSFSGNPLNYLNPADIESIDVLKDADATAIYGSRAANGAILITTKKGKAGKTKIDVNMQQGWGKVTRKLDMLNTRQYLDMRYEAFKNDGIDWKLSSVSANDLKVWDTTRYTDWQKTLIGGTAQYTNINASISGGTASVQYLVGATYHKETTVFPLPKNFEDQKASMHFNLNSVSLNQKFRLQLSANYMVDNNQLPRIDLTQNAIWLEPDAPALYKSDGSLNWAPDATGTSTWDNPLMQLYTLYTNKTNNLLSNALLSYKILPGLEIRSSFGYTNMQTNDFAPTPIDGIRPEDRASIARSALYGNRTLNSWVIEPQATYNKILWKGKLECLLGTSIQQNKSNGGNVKGSGYNSDLVLEDIKSATTITAGASFINIYKYNAVFGRLNYNWQEKYILSMTGRRDGSSRFGAKNQFHNFVSVGGAWIFSQENFVKKNLSFFSFGKLRASYGTTGNDQIGDYGFLSLYSAINAGVPFQNSTGLGVNRLTNPYLQWEETRKLQAGIDLGFLNDRLLFNATYARNRSSNQLLSYLLTSVTGFPRIDQNFPATVQNSSWEFSINTTNIKGKNIVWTSSINLTIPQNKLVAFPNLSTSSYATSLIVGQPIGVIKTYHFSGVNATTGLYQFNDKDGNSVSSPNYPADYNVLINTSPKFYGGFQNSVTYKGLQLDILFQFIKQIGIPTTFNNGSAFGPGSFYSASSNQPVTILDRWQKPGDNAAYQRYYSDAFGSASNQLSYALTSDRGYSDASFIRLKNLSLSWQLPAKWLQTAHLQNCRLYMQGQNLLTITNYQGMDPESQSVFSLPPLRALTIGVQVGL